MRRPITILSTVCLLFLMLWTVSDASAQRVLNANGGFEDAEIGAAIADVANWDLWLSQENTPDIEVEVIADPGNAENKILKASLIDITPAAEPYDGQLAYLNMPLVAGTRYKLELRVRAENPEAATISLDGGPGAQVWGQGISGSDWTVIETGIFTVDTDGARNATVHLASSSNANGQTIYIDHLHLIDVDYVEPAAPPLAFGFESLDGIDSWVNTTSDPGLTLSLSDDAVEGDSSLEFDYDFIASQDWGGSVDIGVSAPGDADFYADMSDADGISLRYKVTAPINNAAHAAFAFKLADVSTPGEGEQEGEIELWEVRSTQVVTDDSGEWQELRMPFSSFAVPSWAYQGNGTLDLDQIEEFQMQVIIGGDGEGNTYEGTILFDDLKLYTDPPPVDNTFAFGFESLDGIGSWVNTSSDPGLTLSLSDDAAEGDHSLEFSYDFIADEEWGGSVDIGVEAPGETGFYADLSDADGITLMYKVIEPSSSTADANFAIKLVDAAGDEEGEGPEERWEYRTPLLLTDDSGEWQELRIPFGSFVLPEWDPSANDVLDLDQISGFEMQVVIGGGGLGNTYTGEFLVDALALYSEPDEPVDPEDPEYPLPPHALGDVINVNGSFELEELGPITDATAWSLGTNSVTTMEIIEDSADDDNRALRYNYAWDPASTETYQVEAVNEPFYPAEGDIIRTSVWLRSDVEGAVAMLYLGLPESGSWARRPGYGQEMSVTLTTEWQEYVYPDYTVIAADVTHADESMRFGVSINFQENDGATIDIDGLRVTKVDLPNSSEGNLAHEFSLKSAYPNPFSGSTTIEYSLDAAGPVSIQVYNLLGQQVATLVDEVQGAGAHRATLDARDLAAGVYVYRIIAGDKTDSKTMMVVR